MAMRQFTKSDWYGYAGAEKFSDGSEPLIGRHKLKRDTHVNVICSRSQIDIEVYNGITDDEDTYILQMPNEQLGKLVAEQIYESICGHTKWVDCQVELLQKYGVEIQIEMPGTKIYKIGVYVISNCLSLEVYRDSNDDWFVKQSTEGAELEKVQLTMEEERNGLMWGEIFIDFNEVQCERLLQPVYGDEFYEEDEHYTPSCTAGDYSPSNPWNAPGMSIHDFI